MASFYGLGIFILPLTLLLSISMGEKYIIIAFILTFTIFWLVIISTIVTSLIGVFYGIQSIRKNEENYKRNIWRIFGNLFFILFAVLTVYGAFFLKQTFSK